METINAPHNPISGVVYQGKNVPALLEANEANMEWATFLQWRSAGYNVTKGSKGTGLIKFVDRSTKTKDGKTNEGKAPVHFKVFNREQVKKISYDKNQLNHRAKTALG